jgi:hypothetical protein
MMSDSTMSDPLASLTGVIRYTIADQVRGLGGSEQDIEGISWTAAYAVWCWRLSEAQRG